MPHCMQPVLRDNLMTANRSRSRLPARRSIALLLLFSACSLPERRGKDLARQFIPPGSMMTANPDWAIATWSARKTYTFETPFTQAHYRSWVKGKLDTDWRSRVETGAAVVFTRLRPTEQQILSFSFEDVGPSGLRVHVIFEAIPT
jgi:hypothetical protein